ncbi:TraB/GumN family protein [Roseobacter sp. SK209-2-6]|uniref:TraB/GumN family protein n=1 Tax=Roseobacter sp. SK209-2-6 TaxID=388739 RepID=UPI00068240F1|nr:TraB/GumN family protein [Roseobacter sp. SK209-2-6]
MPRYLSLLLLLPLLALVPISSAAQCNGKDTRHLAPEEQIQRAQARLAQEPYRSGNYWIARKEDRSIHLVGTLHLNTSGMDEVAASLAKPLAEMDALYLEATPAELKRFERQLSLSPETTFITEGPTLIDLLPAEDWQLIAAQAKAAGMPSWLAAKMRPWFLAISLGIPHCLKKQKDLRNGLDRRLATMAQDLGVPGFSLEDPIVAIQMLNQGSIEEQIQEMRPHLAMMGSGGDNENIVASMIAAYFEEKVLTFLELQREDFLSKTDLPQDEANAMWDDFFADLIQQRNRNWMPVIEAAEGDHIMVAVGALHLPGKGGLLDLLQAEGYTLERETFLAVKLKPTLPESN